MWWFIDFQPDGFSGQTQDLTQIIITNRPGHLLLEDYWLYNGTWFCQQSDIFVKGHVFIDIDFFIKEINTFIQLECTKFIKSDRKKVADIYVTTIIYIFVN